MKESDKTNKLDDGIEMTNGQARRLFEAFEAIPLKGKDTMVAADDMVLLRTFVNAMETAVQKVFDTRVKKGARSCDNDHPAYKKVVEELNGITDRMVTITGLKPISEDGVYMKVSGETVRIHPHISIIKMHGLMVKEKGSEE